MPREKKLISKGMIVNKIKVLKEVDPKVRNNGYSVRRFLCTCECGKKLTIDLGKLTSTKPIQSCGCLRKIKLAQATIERNTTHGLSKHRLYNTWNNMHKRCYDHNSDNYRWYGALGITVCKRWHGDKGLKSFIEWAGENGWEEGLELDRKNNYDRYSPENCRWITHIVNTNNKRHHRTIKYKDKTYKFKDFYSKYNHETVSYKIACLRLDRGWHPIDSVKTPIAER